MPRFDGQRGKCGLFSTSSRSDREETRTVGSHILRLQTRHGVASFLAPEESGQYWQLVMEQVHRRGWVTEKGELFLTSDGNEGIRSAAEIVFGFVVQQRCSWHIAHRAPELTPTSCPAALENSVHWVFNPLSHDQLHECLETFAQRWARHGPQAVESVLRKVPQALSSLVETDFRARPKNAAIAECHNLTYKRCLRSTRGFFRDDTYAGLMRLVNLKHNCARNDGAEWLHLAATDLCPQPIQLHHNTTPPPPSLPTPLSKPPPTTTAYRIGGT